MDLVTVTCDRDLHQQVLQSHSLDKFLTDNCTHWIVVEHTQHPMSYWNDKLSKYYTRHKLNLIDGNINLIDLNLPGYIRQQIIKLAISQLITSDDYLILDSKDVLLRTTSIDDWVTTEGSGVIYNPPIETTELIKTMNGALSNYLPFAKLISALIKLPQPKWFWAPITPFRCKTKTSKQILETVDVNQLFNPNITGVEQVSEFILYRYFSDINTAFLEKGWIKPTNSYFLWAERTLDNDFSVMSNDRYKSVSFHRWYIVNNGSRIKLITDFLIHVIELDAECVTNAFNITYWDNETLPERGWPIFEQSNVGFRNL